MKKAPEAFRTISEVADLLETPAHVLRFWESKFYQIRPVKRAGGRRYYRPDDVALINGIKTLLQDRGMTIRGAQRILQEQGVKAVAQLGLPLPDGGAMLRLVASSEPDLDVSGADTEADFDESEDMPSATDAHGHVASAPGPPAPPADRLPALVPDAPPFAPQMQPEDELTMEMQPSSGYAEPEAEAEVALRIGLGSAAEEQPVGGVAANALDEPKVEDAAMSSDDLLTALTDTRPDAFASAEAKDPVTELLRSRAPVPTAEPAIGDSVDAPDRARLARALRAMPRRAPGLQRDRLAMLARRIDMLLERMSEASGAGRW